MVEAAAEATLLDSRCVARRPGTTTTTSQPARGPLPLPSQALSPVAPYRTACRRAAASPFPCRLLFAANILSLCSVFFTIPLPLPSSSIDAFLFLFFLCCLSVARLSPHICVTATSFRPFCSASSPVTVSQWTASSLHPPPPRRDAVDLRLLLPILPKKGNIHTIDR